MFNRKKQNNIWGKCKKRMVNNVLAQFPLPFPRATEPQPKKFSRRGTENAEKRRGKISAPERRGYSVSFAN